MNTRYYFPPETLANCSIPVSYSSTSLDSENSIIGNRNALPRVPPVSFLVRTVMRISRARWFSFLRRVFHYQNGSRSDLGSNPFNSSAWLALEFVIWVVQISAITIVLAVSNKEKPVWPLRIWVIGYALGSLLSLPLLYWRCRHPYVSPGNGFGFSNIEQQRNNEESRSSYLMNKSRTFLELFFAIWFVMGNVWVFDSRHGTFYQAPNLHILCISLLAWNAITYSFPFLLFVLLCCCVPLISNLLGYNMNMGSVHRGATDDQISQLPKWRFKEIGDGPECNLAHGNENSECCICLAKYRDKEEVRQLPCSHLFHLRCVDQWLRIVSCCPLCKQELEK
ncbi:zinc finger protein [Cinnamomum micranthum f. kanehirae]|uniref:Zinc finger protein n=1 Tax=Cinnamomum micranthum f. kanehirae TaxID=337451 RepID=A0A443NXY2_9MAGN|nr:zinc finger protein [Cinnamomum micranthum f. kanehirae]